MGEEEGRGAVENGKIRESRGIGKIGKRGRNVGSRNHSTTTETGREGDDANGKGDGEREKGLSCPLCDGTYQSKKSLRGHLFKHEAMCRVCKAKFQSIGELMKHLSLTEDGEHIYLYREILPIIRRTGRFPHLTSSPSSPAPCP